MISLCGARCSSSVRFDHSVVDLDSSLIDPPSTIPSEFSKNETAPKGINGSISDRIKLLCDSISTKLNPFGFDIVIHGQNMDNNVILI